MIFDTAFRGRVLQTVEALDYGDAVSNQVVALDLALREMGINSSIHSQWHHPTVEILRSSLDDLQVTDEDVIVLHYAGYSTYMFPFVQKLRCTKVCIYHNITPHEFFEPGSELYELCSKGRQQLSEVVRDCHYFWGDSSYNLQELIDLGANPRNCSVLPIIVGKPSGTQRSRTASFRESGTWLFIGRVAANKGHINLVNLFAKVRAENARYARKLNIVGNYDEGTAYFKSLKDQILQLGLLECVTITGKISDSEVQEYLASASVYVSMSEHEGFGVPLIEAAHHGVPVVALRNSAVGETMGDHGLLAESAVELSKNITDLLSDDSRYEEAVESQKRNALRFSRDAVTAILHQALSKVLPARSQFATVSIVICTLDRSDLLDRCLDYLQHQTNAHFEVVVVNGPSTDSTDGILEKYKDRIKIARNPKKNLAISRNIGIEHSDGDLIAFIDDDALPFDDWVSTLIHEFNARPLTHAAIGGPAYFSGTLRFQAQDIGINGFAATKKDIDSKQIGSDGWERSMLGTNTCFRADIIREVRGFDEQFDYFLDESELSFRLQKKHYIVGYAPSLYLRHEFAKSENRGGKYKFNWFSICKNTAYFVAAYSGLRDKELADYVDQQVETERVRPLDSGFKAGDISRREYEGYVEAIHSGVRQGLSDARGFPRTRNLAPPPGVFSAYTGGQSYPVVGRDLDPLHICIVTKEFPPFVAGGGVGTLYYHLASELLLMGHHVTVIVPGDHEHTFRQGRFAVRYEPIHSVCVNSLGAPSFIGNMNWAISAFHAASDVHSDRRIDVIESALWDSEAIAISLIPCAQRPPLVLRLVTPFPVAARINGWSLSAHECALFRAAEDTLIRNADAVVPISESIAQTIETEYQMQRDARWAVSHCGIAYWPSFDVLSEYSELTSINGRPLGFPAGAKIILFLGRLERRKGIDLLLAAANEFLASDRHAHLVLAGKDVEGWSTSSASSPPGGIAKRTHFVGEVDDATRDKLLHAAYCVVFPSRYESFGLVPLEAFVHGTPVVATNAGAIPEVVVAHECGLLFEPEDSTSLAACVIRLLAEPQLRERLSGGARNRIRAFSSRRSAIQSVVLYARLLSEKALKGTTRRRADDMRVVAAGASRTIAYSGSHGRLLTQCGRRDGDWIKSTRAEGFLLYGPYVDLPAARYKADIFGRISSLGAPNPVVEVLTNSGKVKLASHVLTETCSDTQLVSIEFSLESPAQVEVRIWIAANADVSVSRLAIIMRS